MIHYAYNHNDDVICPVYTSYCSRSVPHGHTEHAPYHVQSWGRGRVAGSQWDTQQISQGNVLDSHYQDSNDSLRWNEKGVCKCTWCPCICMCIITTHWPTAAQTHCTYCMCVIHTRAHMYTTIQHTFMALLPSSLLRMATVTPWRWLSPCLSSSARTSRWSRPAPVLINIIKVQGVLYTKAVFCDCTEKWGVARYMNVKRVLEQHWTSVPLPAISWTKTSRYICRVAHLRRWAVI